MNRVNKFIKGFSATGVLLMLLGMAALTTSCDDDDATTTDTRPYTINGSANGSQQVPAVTTNGTATITGTYNPVTKELNYTSNWANLSAAPTAGGFYMGATGVAGAAIGTPWVIASGSTETGTTTGKMTLTDEQAKSLLAGSWYYSYNTVANPGGEVRGQIAATR